MKKKAVIILIISGLVLFLLLEKWTRISVKETGSIKIYDRKGELIYESINSKGSTAKVKNGEISPDLINAVIAAEDSEYRTHKGFDLPAILKAVFTNIRENRVVTGASTITQQTVRLVIFNQKELNANPYIRKVHEILTAVRFSYTASKDDILNIYLNNVYFGHLNYGVEAASQYYFNKKAINLSLAESAMLAGIISSPTEYDPVSYFAKAKERQEHVLSLMVKNKMIGQGTAEQARNEEVSILLKNEEYNAMHFTDYILSQLDNMNINSSETLNIYTTLDLPLYKTAREIATNWVRKLSYAHELTNAAIIMIDNETGAIPVMLGGIYYFDEENSGAVNMTTAIRQPGSSIKPLTYALAIGSGYTPASVIRDEQKVYITGEGEGFTPRNYDNLFHGDVTLREALASSLNMPAVEMLSRVGVPEFLRLAKSMGISTLVREDIYDLSITLGGGEIKLIELTNSYATFARRGNYLPFYSIERITDASGNNIYQHASVPSVQTLGEHGPQISFLITDILSDQKARMLGFKEKNMLVLSKPTAVKTGTTTDWHDVWVIGYNPKYSVGVWVGNNDNHPMKDISGVTGGAPIFNQFFEKVLAEMPDYKFEVPQGIISEWVCIKTEGDVCLKYKNEYFIEGTAPGNSSPIVKKTDNQSSEVGIIFPKPKAVFELAPELVQNETIVFQINVPEDTASVEWELNGTALPKQEAGPFDYNWVPSEGNYKLGARVFSNSGRITDSGQVNFLVVSYKSGLENN